MLFVASVSTATEVPTPVFLDSVIQAQMQIEHVPGVSACIIKDDTILWQGMYGWADIAAMRPISDSSVFQLASLSKPVTGAAIMNLWENQLFQLDDDINEVLSFTVRNPDFPDSVITYRQLLTHT
jgi:CubicO group peptidase (beta-lactamase class C family)